jgi:hypothetical protein
MSRIDQGRRFTVTASPLLSGKGSTRTIRAGISALPRHGADAYGSKDTRIRSPSAYSRLLTKRSPSPETSSVIASSNQGMRSGRTRTGIASVRRRLARRSRSVPFPLPLETACLTLSNRIATRKPAGAFGPGSLRSTRAGTSGCPSRIETSHGNVVHSTTPLE